MRDRASYTPLDVEIRLASADPEGWELPNLEQSTEQRRAHPYTTAAAAAAVVALVAMAGVLALPSAQYDAAGQQQPPPAPAGRPSAADGVWNEHGGPGAPHAGAPHHDGTPPPPQAAGFAPCSGLPEIACGMVSERPRRDKDFRDLPRRVEARGGAVAADSSRCSQIGAGVLDDGGNAVDSAVATALCLGVVNPISSGLGGGAFILIRMANGSSVFINAREPAPAAANATMYEGLHPYASLDGGLAVGVPCELRGLEAAWRSYGRLPWARLVAPAAGLARSGFAAHPYLIYTITGPYNFNRIKSIPALRDAFLIQNGTDSWRAPFAGELCCRRPKLADTLDRVAERGADWLHTGPVAERLAAEVREAGGVMTKEDIEGVRPAITQTLKAQLGDLDLILPPPPSSAAVVAFALKMLAGYGDTLRSPAAAAGAAPSGGGAEGGAAAVGASAAAGSKGTDTAGQPAGQTSGQPASQTAGQKAGAAAGGRRRRLLGQLLVSFGVDHDRDQGLGLQRLIEAQKHGFAVRTALGDPGTADAPFEMRDEILAAVSDLINDTFIDSLRSLTSDDGVLPPTSYGGRWNPVGRGAPPDDHGTTHFCVVDRDRNAVSVTSTVNTVFGSGVVSESTGIVFNNQMDDFSQPNRTSLVTPHPSPANFIAPGKRPLSAMSPIVAVERETGRLVAVAGGSGGPLIVSATLQTLARLLLEGADPSDAVASARLHDQLLPLPTKTFFENGTWAPVSHQLPKRVVSALESRGQSLDAQRYGLGVSQAILVDYGPRPAEGREDGGRRAGGSSGVGGGGKGTLIAVSDVRKDGAPFGAE